MNPSSNLFLVGPSGAGKTSIGRLLAAHYQLEFIDLDIEIEKHTGAPVTAVFELEGEAGFRARESALLDQLSQRQGIVLSTGAGAILDPVNRDRLRARGLVVWLQSTVDQQLRRLQHDQHRPLLAGQDREQRLQTMARIRTPLYAEIGELRIPGEYESVTAATARSIPLIDQHWQRLPAAMTS
ncbi:shikimate kinase [Frateuria aurantia]